MISNIKIGRGATRRGARREIKLSGRDLIARILPSSVFRLRSSVLRLPSDLQKNCISRMRFYFLVDINNSKNKIFRRLEKDKREKIDRYIEGTADDSEREFVESLLNEGESNLYLRKCLEKDWNSLIDHESSVVIDLNPLLDRIHHKIIKNETVKKNKPLKKLIQVYMKVAAMLLIPLMVAGGLVYTYLTKSIRAFNEENVAMQIYAPMGSRVSFNLPDGTTGMLNSGSRLDYSVPFTTHRIVKIEGEAWFEVYRDEEHPFEITTGSSVVKVMGTSFNISAYPAEKYIEVVLNSGRVEYHSGISEEKVILMPSERLVCYGGKTSKSVVDPDKYSAWTEGKLVFRGDLMAEVARRIERWYNVRVIIADKELEKYSFRATFQDDSLEEVLKLLAMTSPIRYKITPRKLMTDGTFNAEEITIYKKQ